MDENAVVNAVCEHLEAEGYKILSRLTTSQQGIDVEAQHKSHFRKVLVEAKGGTSSKPESARFGRPYTRSQVFDRVAKGIFTCLQLRAANPNCEQARILLALPSGEWFSKYIESVGETLRRTDIEVWFVPIPSAASDA
jgi:hypothetical protein